MKKFRPLTLIIIAVVMIIGLVSVAYYFFSTSKITKIGDFDNQAKFEVLLQAPNQDTIAKAEEAIKTLMALSNLTFNHVTVQKNPSNFSVGKITVIGDGATRMDTPLEWNRPVYVIEQKEYIDDLCEVYEYEVSAETNQVVEVHVKAKNIPLHSVKCKIYGSLGTPLKSKAEIEKIAMDFLGKNITNFEQIKSQVVYISSKKGTINPAFNEWKWEDKNYKLPAGLGGSIPTIRIIISSGGKLIYYFNSSETLNFIFRYGVGAKNELNTFSQTYTKDMVMDSPVTVSLKLTGKEITDVYKKINDLELFDIKQATETNTRVTPCSSYYLKVQSGYHQKGLTWDSCQGKINDKLQKFTDYIIKIIESKEEYKALPKPKGGYALDHNTADTIKM